MFLLVPNMRLRKIFDTPIPRRKIGLGPLSIAAMLLLITTAYSGCIGQDEDNQDPDDQDEPAPLIEFTETFDLQFSQRQAFSYRGASGTNCVDFRNSPFEVAGGNATLHWEPQSEFTTELKFDVYWGDIDHGEGVETAGTSPLNLEWNGPGTIQSSKYLSFGVFLNEPVAVAVSQTVVLEITFWYQGADPEASFWACA